MNRTRLSLLDWTLPLKWPFMEIHHEPTLLNIGLMKTNGVTEYGVKLLHKTTPYAKHIIIPYEVTDPTHKDLMRDVCRIFKCDTVTLTAL